MFFLVFENWQNVVGFTLWQLRGSIWRRKITIVGSMETPCEDHPGTNKKMPRLLSLVTQKMETTKTRHFGALPKVKENQSIILKSVNTYLSSENTNYTLNFGINNLFDEAAYDFAVSSTFHDDAHYGLSNVYPLPGRNLFFDLAYTF